MTTYAYADSVADYLRAALDEARLDVWATRHRRSSDAGAALSRGLLRRTLAAEYLCAVAATGGQVGGFLRTDAAPLLRKWDRTLYVADWNLAGAHIETNTRRVLEGEVELLAWTRVAMLRRALRRGFARPEVRQPLRPPRPHNSVEIEALGHARVMEIVRDALDTLLPEPLDRVHEREQEQREMLRRCCRTRRSDRSSRTCDGEAQDQRR